MKYQSCLIVVKQFYLYEKFFQNNKIYFTSNQIIKFIFW